MSPPEEQQLGIAKVAAGESRNFPDNGLNLMVEHEVDVRDLNMKEPGTLLVEFIELNPGEWHWDRANSRMI